MARPDIGDKIGIVAATSTLVIDADLDLAEFSLKTNSILESTENMGVTVDGALHKDGVGAGVNL